MKLRASPHLLLLVVTLLFTLLPVQAAFAQTADVTFSNVLVDIWPEYDQPGVLVMYTLTLSPTVSLPANISLRIPAAVGQPHAVAMQDVAGMYDLNYTLVAAAEWIEVQFTTPVPDVRIEYYDPGLEKDGARRSFIYRWPANYGVQNLTVRVQQPLGAENVSFRPDIGGGRADEDGLIYYTLVAGQVNAGSDFELRMEYDKENDALTNPQQFQPASPSQPIDSSTPGSITLFQGLSITPLQLGLLILGLSLIIGGVFWYWLTSGMGRAANQRGAGRRRHAAARAGNARLANPRAANPRAANPRAANLRAAAQAGESEEAGEPVFCHQCGKKSGPDDLYCRACGTELR